MKLFLLLLEIAIILGVIAFVWSQLVWPMIKGTPVFPMFGRRSTVERELEDVNEAIDEKARRAILEERRGQLDASAQQPPTNRGEPQ